MNYITMGQLKEAAKDVAKANQEAAKANKPVAETPKSKWPFVEAFKSIIPAFIFQSKIPEVEAVKSKMPETAATTSNSVWNEFDAAGGRGRRRGRGGRGGIQFGSSGHGMQFDLSDLPSQAASPDTGGSLTSRQKVFLATLGAGALLVGGSATLMLLRLDGARSNRKRR